MEQQVREQSPKTPTKFDDFKAYKDNEIAKEEKVLFYNTCYPANPLDKYVNVEGPEFSQDYSYFIVNMSQEI
jgi:hypothetical protein